MSVRTFLLSLGFLFSSAVYAQNEQDTVIALPTVIILDSLGAVIPRDGIASRVISAERISTWAGASVADLLGAESFVHVRQFGASGLSTVSLRGSGSEHTAITLDGVSLVDPQSGRLDLSTVPVTFLESVLVSSGAGRKSGGQGALGGTIELRSIAPTNRPFLRTTLVTGAFGRRQGGAVLSRALGPVKALIAVDLSEYEGDFPFKDLSSFPVRTARRNGTGRSVSNFFGRMAVPTRVGAWDASVWRSDSRRGVPGPANAPPKTAEQTDQATRIRISNTFQIRRGSVGLHFALSDISLEYLDAEAQQNGGQQRSDTRAVNFSASVKRVISHVWMLQVESLLRHERSRIQGWQRQSNAALDISAAFDKSRSQGLLGASLSRWYDGINAHLRLLPRASIRYLPAGTDRFTIRGSAGQVFRPPSFSDRFWVPGGNAALLPESGWTADAGITAGASHDTGTIEFTATLFWSSLKDKIIWHPSLIGSQIQIWTPDNVGKVVGYGAESSIDLGWRTSNTSRLEAMILYSLTRSEDRTDPVTRSFGRQLRYVPQHTVKGRISFVIRSVLIETSGEWVSKRYTSSDQRLPLPGYRVLSVRVRQTLNFIGGRLVLQTGLNNALNENIEHIRFYPMPPRHLTFSLQFHFHQPNLDAL